MMPRQSEGLGVVQLRRAITPPGSGTSVTFGRDSRRPRRAARLPALIGDCTVVPKKGGPHDVWVDLPQKCSTPRS